MQITKCISLWKKPDNLRFGWLCKGWFIYHELDLKMVWYQTTFILPFMLNVNQMSSKHRWRTCWCWFLCVLWPWVTLLLTLEIVVRGQWCLRIPKRTVTVMLYRRQDLEPFPMLVRFYRICRSSIAHSSRQ